MKMIIDIQDARKGDILRFSSYSLRVDTEPERTPKGITLCGRIDTGGCPIVRKTFLRAKHTSVTAERENAADEIVPRS